MKVFYDLNKALEIKFPVVTTGTFDGVHIGHKSIIDRVNEIAEKSGGESVLMTYHPHPRSILFPDEDIKIITTIEEKIELLEKAGLQNFIVFPFTKEFSKTSSLDYIKNILVDKIGTKKLVIGYNHMFGRNREGSFEHLLQYGPRYGFEVEEISAQVVDQVNVSSTKIRRAILEGNVELANEYLGHNFTFKGKVIHGNKLGRTIGYPTANLQIEDKEKIIPSFGVYAVKVHFKNNIYLGMMNIGMRPVLPEQSFAIEINIFDFDFIIYNEYLKIEVFKKLRNEESFENFEALKLKLQHDKENVVNYFQSV